jgi:DNA modification methylase
MPLDGDVILRGEPAVADALAGAWHAARNEGDATLTHGFHTWPARMHPAMARELVRLTTRGERGRTVLDPFMGGGTVLVEARVLGHRAIGVDLNPLAARVAMVRADPPPAEIRAQLLVRAKEVALRSEERVRAREPVVARLPKPMLPLYTPHVLKELAGLLEEIRALPPRSRDVLEIVFSALVVKLSRKKADTSDDLVEKRLRKGLATELFLRKTEELVLRWEELAAVLPEDAPPPRVFTGDARTLPGLVRGPIDAIVTSPPYGGTYDYHGQHALRLAWLGLPDRAFFRGEIGARGTGSAAQWSAELTDVLRAMRAVVADDARIALVIGDGEIRGQPLPVLPQLEAIAPDAGLVLLASASVPRPDFRLRERTREEHVVALAPARRHRTRPVR